MTQDQFDSLPSIYKDEIVFNGVALENIHVVTMAESNDKDYMDAMEELNKQFPGVGRNKESILDMLSPPIIEHKRYSIPNKER
jgi:hypothetical protein